MNTPSEKKTVVVTGGAGFIGSHLCDELVKTSRVICIDNFITGSEENIHHLLPNPDFKFIKHDMSVPLDFDAYPELRYFRIPFQGIQEVYNLACPTSPKDYTTYRVETLLANALGTKNALDIALEYKSVFVHLSSSAIYGEPLEDSPFLESYWGFVDPIGNRSSYIEGKRFAESLVVNYGERYTLDAKILRVFNTYGPRMKLTDGRLIPDFVNAALNNKPLTIFGDESSMSTFNYISDLVEAILKMASSSEKGPFNVGNPEAHLMKEVAEKVVALVGSESTITYGKHLAFTAKQGIADISLAKEHLGWFPVISLDEGLKRTIEHMKGTKVLRLSNIG